MQSFAKRQQVSTLSNGFEFKLQTLLTGACTLCRLLQGSQCAKPQLAGQFFLLQPYPEPTLFGTFLPTCLKPSLERTSPILQAFLKRTFQQTFLGEFSRKNSSLFSRTFPGTVCGTSPEPATNPKLSLRLAIGPHSIPRKK